MENKDKFVLDLFEQVIPSLSELEKEKLLSYGEGIHFMVEQQKRAAQIEQQDVS